MVVATAYLAVDNRIRGPTPWRAFSFCPVPCCLR